ncbi:MAG: hypothetical protein ACO1QS_09845 [Verrucomicrobiota bacterium]
MMLPRWLYLSILLWALLANRPVSAQSVDTLGQQVPWVAAALSEFLSDSRSFIARLEVQLPAEPGEKPLTLPFALALDQGQMRLDLRLAEISPDLLPAEFLTPLKQAGWDRLLLLYHPQAATRLVVPAEKKYVEFPKSTNGPAKMENDAMLKLGRMEKKLLNIESLDGHPCRKYRLTSKEGDQVEEAYVWEAIDLNALPIKLSVKTAGQVYTFQLRQVRMGRPDPRSFAIPADYRKTGSAQELLAGVMLKSLGAGRSPSSLVE